MVTSGAEVLRLIGAAAGMIIGVRVDVDQNGPATVCPNALWASGLSINFESSVSRRSSFRLRYWPTCCCRFRAAAPAQRRRRWRAPGPLSAGLPARCLTGHRLVCLEFPIRAGVHRASTGPRTLVHRVPSSARVHTAVQFGGDDAKLRDDLGPVFARQSPSDICRVIAIMRRTAAVWLISRSTNEQMRSAISAVRSGCITASDLADVALDYRLQQRDVGP
jgi:hypothetical protein